MFGMGGTEILVILIVALLFLGPDKLPEAAKSISKGIRDLRKQTREFQETIEADERLGGAIRDIKSALNGEDPRPRPRPARIAPPTDAAAAAASAAAAAASATAASEVVAEAAEANAEVASEVASEPVAPSVTLPPVAGEPQEHHAVEDAQELAALIKPPEGAVAKGSSSAD